MEGVPPPGLISVILPTRNRAGWLSRAAKSVLAQSYTHVELIVVDDASSDRTPDVLSALKDPRVICIRNEIARGPGASRNAGLVAARGEFVAFLDDDDEFLPGKLLDQINAFQSAVTSVGVVISPVEFVRNGAHFDFFPYNGESGSIFLNVLAGNTFPLNAILVRNHQLPRFDERLPCLEDVDFCLKLLQNTKALFIESPCGICRLDDDTGRASSNRINLYRSFRIFQQRWFNDPQDILLRKAQADLLVHFALRQFTLGNLDEASREFLKRAFVVRRDARTALLRIQNALGQGFLRWVYARKGGRSI